MVLCDVPGITFRRRPVNRRQGALVYTAAIVITLLMTAVLLIVDWLDAKRPPVIAKGPQPRYPTETRSLPLLKLESDCPEREDCASEDPCGHCPPGSWRKCPLLKNTDH